MSSFTYPSAVKKMEEEFYLTGVKMALLTVGYVPSKDHVLFSEISANEVVSAGYVAGGVAITATVNADGSVTYGDASWPLITCAYRYAVIYRTGGELIELIDPLGEIIVVSKELIIQMKSSRKVVLQ